MNASQHEQARPNLAGLASPVQQAEMKLILAGKWPPLKPLPVFKYETGEFRAAIDFDKLRGEWVCRKISFPSNKVQELRGPLTQITAALPHGPAEVPAEVSAEELPAEQQEQELEKDAHRRLQAFQQWRENFESGAFYSELRHYLSESQQAEIDESIRLSLTARQLQVNPKNVAYVFDALSHAGGRLATLLEIAQRNKAGPQAVSPTLTEAPALETGLQVPAENLIPATLEDIQDEPIGSPLPRQNQSPSLEWITLSASQTNGTAAPEPLHSSIPSFIEDFPEEQPQYAELPVSPEQVPANPFDSSADPLEGSPSHRFVLEISAFHIAALAAVILLAVIALTVGLTEGRGLLGKRLLDAQKSMLPVDAASPVANSLHPPSVNPPAPPKDVAPAESPSAPILNASAGPIDRNAPSPSPTSAPPESVAPIRGASINPATRSLSPAMSAIPYRSSPSAILFTLPSSGSKPFRVNFQEKTIAASRSMAITSRLSVLVAPEPGLATTHPSARLQAAELLSFVWPRYPKRRNRYESAETVKVRTTIGPLGQVLDVKLLSGSTSLLPATSSALRLWHFKPARLNNRPVPSQQEVSIYVAHAATQHPPHN